MQNDFLCEQQCDEPNEEYWAIFDKEYDEWNSQQELQSLNTELMETAQYSCDFV